MPGQGAAGSPHRHVHCSVSVVNNQGGTDYWIYHFILLRSERYLCLFNSRSNLDAVIDQMLEMACGINAASRSASPSTADVILYFITDE